MASEYLFLLLLSFIACSSGTFTKDHQVFQLSRRELFNNFHLKVVENGELVDPPSLNFPTTPLVTNPVTTPSIVPPDNSATPTIVTIPATIPIATTPIPVATPAATVPPATPIPVPNTNPVTPAVPVTNPVTTPSTNPVTNPVTTPTPSGGGVPVTTPPVTNPNPTPTPANTNAPAVPGQTWCVAKSGLQETALQSALDYACGIGGADCSAIQQSGVCYNPNSLQNHASFAFNSYYQKNPSPTSCDFGGTAMVTSTNPSSGSCIYPLSSSSSSSSSPPAATASTGPAVPGSSPGTGAGAGTGTGAGAGFGTGTPPNLLNASNPMPGGAMPGFADSPPTTISSMSNKFQYFSCISTVATILTGIITMF